MGLCLQHHSSYSTWKLELVWDFFLSLILCTLLQQVLQTHLDLFSPLFPHKPITPAKLRSWVAWHSRDLLLE